MLLHQDSWVYAQFVGLRLPFLPSTKYLEIKVKLQSHHVNYCYVEIIIEQRKYKY